MSGCAKCKLKKTDGLVGCEGSCGKWFHHTCIGLTLTDFSLLEKCKNLLFICDLCRIKCEITDKSKNTLCVEKLGLINNKVNDLSAKMETLLQSKLEELQSSIKSQIDLFFKNEVIPQIRETDSMSAPKITSYASVVQNKPALMVQPKDKSQKVRITKSDMLKIIDPIESDISLTTVRNISNGGLIIGCKNVDESAKFKSLAIEKLSENYEIREVMPLNPRIKVVGISESASEDTILKFILTQNKCMFPINHVCKLLTLAPLKKNKQVYQATLQVDRVTYNNIMAQGKLFVGYDYCSVFDAIDLRRCFKCSGFHHIAAKCSAGTHSCPRCAESHQLSDCQSNFERCINCVNLNKKQPGLNLDINHKAWDKNCTVYKQELDKLRSNILNPQ